MRKSYLFSICTIALLLLFFLNVKATSISVSGTISTNTTWTGVDTVKVIGNIVVQDAITLTIDPGILVEFQGYYYITVEGRLLAVGTASDKITFTVADTTGYHNYSHTGWNGLVFWEIDNANDTSRVVHCKLEYGKATPSSGHSSERGGAVCIAGSHKISVDHCEFLNNYSSMYGGAIFIWNTSNANISNCNIHHNYSVYGGGGIYSWDSHNLYNSIVSNNTSDTEGGGIYLFQGTFDYRNNLISDNVSSNYGGGIFFNDSYNSTFINNTVSNNHAHSGGGIAIENGAPTFRNNIIYGNTVSHSSSQIYHYLYQSTAHYHYCDIEDYNGSGVGGSGNSNFSNCIDIDPDFINSGDNPYCLSATSQCINTGDPSTTTVEAGLYDLAGNPRIYDGFVDRIDIGAYEYQGDPKPAIVSVFPTDNSKILNITPTLEIEFSIEVTVQSGYITIYNDDNSVFEQIAANNTSLVTVDSVSVSINPNHDFACNNSYYILIDSLAFSSINGQKFSGIYDQTSWNFDVVDIYGYPGTSLKFDGTDDYVEIPDNDLLDLTTNYTIEAWIYPKSFGDLDGIVSKYQSSGAHGYYIRLHPDSPNTGLNFDGMLTSNGILTANEWHHIVGVNENGIRKLYVNGELQNLTGTPNIIQTNTNPVRIGVDYSSRYFHGDIDEVRIWNVPLTEAQIRENMNSPLSGTESGLISYFQFNEGQGTVTHDFISGYIGTLTNMTANDWVNSAIPFGGGAVNSQFVSATGNVVFTNTGLSADFTAKTGTDTIVVARIDTVPNITPATVDTVYDAQYWVVNSFGNGTFTANLSFTIAEDLTPDDQVNPSNVRLYGRAVTSHHNDWTLISPANAVDAASNTATFNDISSFGQFILGRHEGTTPFLMTHLSPEDEGSMIYDHNLEITFNEVATDVTGKSIWLYKSNGTLVEEFTLPSSQITGSGTDKIIINPTDYLILDKEYYVLIDSGAFQDPFGKDYAGISDPDEWNFRVLIQGHIVSNTIWQDTIIATGNVYVDDGVTLTVAPGTYVEFYEYSKLDIKGTLLAVGTDANRITFTKQPNYNRWNAIVFHNTPSSNDSSKIAHCILEYAEGDYSSFAGGPVYVDGFNKLIISNCIFRHNEGWSSALDCHNCEFVVKNNIFHNNKGSFGPAISCFNNGNVKFINNVLRDNQASWLGGAMSIEMSEPVLINNTICNNTVTSDEEAEGGGICLSESAIVLRNNILYGNTVNGVPNQVYIEYDGHDPDFYYCDIEGGKDAFSGPGAGENYNGNYENNIDEDPQFTGTGIHPYQIELSSPCYNAGDPATTTADVGTVDAAGNFRIENGTIDIGAYESYRTTDNFPGYALDFDGTNDHIYIPHTTSLNNSHFSVEFWVQMDDIPGEWKGIIDKGRDTNTDWHFLTGASGNEQGVIFGIQNGIYRYELHYSWNDADWHHIAGTYNGTTMELYIDGIQISSASATMQVTTNNIAIGCRRDITWFFKGKLDEVRIWNVKREAEDIRENMHLSFPGSENGLVSYWQLNEGSGAFTNDYISGNDGALRNMTNDSWVNSDIPFGGGESNSQSVSSPGNVSFTNINVSIDFTAKTGTDVFVATRIDTLPNLNPENVTAVFDSQYWVINKFGNGTFMSDITFTINEELTPLDESEPDRIKLYKRSSTSDSAWTFYANASQVDATNNSATFNGISGLSQFIICRKATTDTVPGNALEFDGINDYVSGTGIDTTLSAITIEAWVYHDSMPGTVQRYVTIQPEVAVLRHDGTAYGGYHELHFYIKKSNGSLLSLRVDSIETTNKWMHICGTYDGSILKLYLNGILLDSSYPPEEGLYAPNGGFVLSKSGETMYGKMDEVRIWNYARTNKEIRENMHRTCTGMENGLVNYWQLNSSSGTTAIDIINGANGTLHHMDAADWVTSSVPTGIGSSNTQIFSSTGTVDFSGTGLSMDFVSVGGDLYITATRIDLNPNINPPGNYTSFDSQYWVVTNFYPNNYTINITFEVNEDLTVSDEIYPASIKLFRRGHNSESDWILADSAHSVNATDKTVTFNGIHHLSQFLIARDSVLGIFPPANMYINEFMASNEVAFPGPQVDYPDWIEIYNAGEEDIMLGGYYMADDLSDPGAMYQIPATYHDSVTVAAGGYILFYANKGNETSVLNLNFKLSAGGEQVGLWSPDHALIDSITYPAQITDTAYGRYEDGTDNWYFMPDFSPGEPNRYVNAIYENEMNVSLKQNYPNPFNSVTNIEFTLDEPGQVRITVYTVSGSIVSVLTDNYYRNGKHVIQWKASDLPAGYYFYSIQTSTGIEIKKASIIK